MKKFLTLIIVFAMLLVPVTAFAASNGWDATDVTPQEPEVEIVITPYIVGFTGEAKKLESTDTLQPNQMYLMNVLLTVTEAIEGIVNVEVSDSVSGFYQIQQNVASSWTNVASNTGRTWSTKMTFQPKNYYQFNFYFTSDGAAFLEDIAFNVVFDPIDGSPHDTHIVFMTNGAKMLASRADTSANWCLSFEADPAVYIECETDGTGKITNMYFTGSKRYIAVIGGLQDVTNLTSLPISSGADYNNYIAILNALGWTFDGTFGYLTQRHLEMAYIASYCVEETYTIKVVNTVTLPDAPSIEPPQTGDKASLIVPVLMFGLAIGGCVFYFVKRKRTN